MNGVEPENTSFDQPHSPMVDSNPERFCRILIHCALLRGKVDLVQLFQSHGVKMRPTFDPLEEIITPLHITLRSNSREMVQYVLQ